jgi:YVTN family beta-propeller protein
MVKETVNKLFGTVGAIVLALFSAATARADAGEYLSPVALAADAAAQKIYIAESTANQVQEFDVGINTVTRTFSLPDSPSGAAVSPDGGRLYVTGGSYYGKVFVVDLGTGAVTETIAVGHTPMSPVLSADGATLYVCNRFDNDVSAIDLAARNGVRIPVKREPVAMAITPDSKYLFVANHLPFWPPGAVYQSAAISVIDTVAGEETKTFQLMDGLTGSRGMCMSPDGKYVYVTHVLGRYKLSTNQIDRGGIMTNALTIIDAPNLRNVNTVLLDDIDNGAANPWGVACSADGKYLCVTHAGTHELSVIDRTALHDRLDRIAAGETVSPFSDKAKDVPHDFAFLSGLRRRVKLGGNGPRGLAIVGNRAYIAEYFTGTIGIADISPDQTNVQSLPLGPEKPLTTARRGEMLFNDAQYCFQQWLSCASCHPDVRSDSLTWDLGNDGFGNARSAKSLLLAHKTPPAMITGVRDSAEVAVRAGFKFLQFSIRPEEDAAAVDEYLKSLEPVPSPHLVNGQLSEAAQRGKEVFERASCVFCHSGEYFTDLRRHDVGTGNGAGERLDTPTLVEVWRTGPYLQDGRAGHMDKVFTLFNESDRHGKTSRLSALELDDLVEYVLSIGPLPEPEAKPATRVGAGSRQLLIGAALGTALALVLILTLKKWK